MKPDFKKNPSTCIIAAAQKYSTTSWKNFPLYLSIPARGPKYEIVFKKILKCYKKSENGLQFSV